MIYVAAAFVALVLLWVWCICRAAGRADRRAADEQGRAEAIRREMERMEMAVFYEQDNSSEAGDARWTGTA